MSDFRKRILFLGEGVSLAHVTRGMVLARGLDPERWEVRCATSPRYAEFVRREGHSCETVHTLPFGEFAHRAGTGRMLYDAATIRRYLAAEMELFRRLRPAVVVGDFRLSLALSTRLAGVPYINLTNAHWSPRAALRPRVPDLPVVSLLGPRLGQWLFNAVRPAAFRWQAAGFNSVARALGLASVRNLSELHTQGDFTAFLDPPGLIPLDGLPRHQRVIGPTLWSPRIGLPDWWMDLPIGRPRVYLTLGSTGDISVLGAAVAAVSEVGATAMVATAGRMSANGLPAGTFAADYLPGLDVLMGAAAAVTNGGSATVYQALARGVPVVGVASNMDQFMTMAAVESAGAGILVRAGAATTRSVGEALDRVLTEDGFRASAQRLARRIAQTDATASFAELVEAAAGSTQPAPASTILTGR